VRQRVPESGRLEQIHEKSANQTRVTSRSLDVEGRIICTLMLDIPTPEGWKAGLTYLIVPWPGVEPAAFRSRVRRRTTAPPRHLVSRKLLEIHRNERREAVSSRECEQIGYIKRVWAKPEVNLVRGTWKSLDVVVEDCKALAGAYGHTVTAGESKVVGQFPKF